MLPDDASYFSFVTAEFVLAAVTLAVLSFIAAPYGRHREGSALPQGPLIPSRLGWILMESPAVLVYIVIFAQGEHRADLVPLLLLGMWQLHYVHRTFIFPFRLRASGKKMPLYVALLAVGFNLLNAYVNARWISHLGDYGPSWLTDPRFLLGVVVFFVGMGINLHSDTVLLNLRKPGESGYKIPQGGLYRWVSSPNYLGEIIEWFGWALATWSLGGLAFAVYTFANLAPRAITNHRWYLEKFPDSYPERRRALIPWLW